MDLDYTEEILEGDFARNFQINFDMLYGKSLMWWYFWFNGSGFAHNNHFYLDQIDNGDKCMFLIICEIPIL